MGKNHQVELSARPGGGPIDHDQKRKSWPGLSAQFVRIAGLTTYDFKLISESNYVALHDIYRADGQTSVVGLPRSHMKDIRNKITFLPSNCPIEGWTQTSKPASFLALYIDQSGGDSEPIDLSKLQPQLNFEDQMLRSVLSRFQSILHDPSIDTPGYAETLGVLLTYELGRVSSRHRNPTQHRGGLTPRQTRLVVDYIESHLTEDTTISELAALLDLTRFHFIRAFKQSVGSPPHRYIVQRRIERAKELLEHQNISISEVAAQIGFGGVAQLTKAFRRVTGTTPSAFRREAT